MADGGAIVLPTVGGMSGGGRTSLRRVGPRNETAGLAPGTIQIHHWGRDKMRGEGVTSGEEEEVSRRQQTNDVHVESF